MVGAQKKLLITRALEDAAPLAALLDDQGIETLIDPMLQIDFISGPQQDLSDVQAVLMTSANGVRAFAKRNPERQIVVYAVGDATMREAAAQGFMRVQTASGDVGALAALVIESSKPGAGAFLHVAGTVVAGDLGAALANAGYMYRRQVMYQATAASELSAETCAALDAGHLTGVSFYSPRTAMIFCNCLRRAGRDGQMTKIKAFCLSPAVADALSEVNWQVIKIAEKPTQLSLLEIVLDSV